MKRKEIVLTKETRKKEYVKKVMDSIAPHLNLKSHHKVAIKVNLAGQREIYANTNYETVESLIFYLKDHFGISEISVVEGSDGAFYSGKTTWEIFYKFKYKEVELNGAKLANLDEMPHNTQFTINTLSGVKQVSCCRPEADYLISVVPPKTHNIFPVHLSILNMIGFVKPEDRVLVYGATAADLKKINSFKDERFIQLLDNGGKNLARLVKEITPSLTLIDGLFGMEGKGPIKGSPVFHGFAIASEDVVLADALATYIMGFEVDQVPYLTYAYREGIGNNRWQNIIGVDPASVKFPYRPHPIFPKQKLWSEHYLQQRRPDRDRDRDRNYRERRPYRDWDRDRDNQQRRTDREWDNRRPGTDRDRDNQRYRTDIDRRNDRDRDSHSYPGDRSSSPGYRRTDEGNNK